MKKSVDPVGPSGLLSPHYSEPLWANFSLRNKEKTGYDLPCRGEEYRWGGAMCTYYLSAKNFLTVPASEGVYPAHVRFSISMI